MLNKSTPESVSHSYPSIQNYAFCFVSHDAHLLSLPVILQVHITVMDNNDNSPIFSQSTYDVTISEDTPPDTEVVQVLASDRDEHHRLTYSLQSSIDPSSFRLFHIHPTLGTIYTTQRLDHEACTQHILTVMVRRALAWTASCTKTTRPSSDITD